MRGVLNGVSPLIWRRLLVRADTTIADLHAVVQTAFGWDGEHLLDWFHITMRITVLTSWPGVCAPHPKGPPISPRICNG